MCANYQPATLEDILKLFGLLAEVLPPYELESYPASAAPFVRNSDGQPNVQLGCFGLIPNWAQDTKIARMTYNARSETVSTKPSFRGAWARRQFALVPARAIYEPNYESGRAIRWRIERQDQAPFAIAAIWDRWHPRPGQDVLSFSMLTVNAENNALMRRFHAPTDEKRSVVVIESSDFDRWLTATKEEAMGMLKAPDPESFTSTADPRPSRKRS